MLLLLLTLLLILPGRGYSKETRLKGIVISDIPEYTIIKADECKYIIISENRISIDYRSIIEVEGYLLKLKSYKNPGNFDYNRYLRKKGYCGYIKAKKIRIIKLATKSVLHFPHTLRLYLYQRASEVEEPSARLIKSLILGIKESLKDDEIEALRSMGLAHVIAISGLHFAIFFGTIHTLLNILFRLIYLKWPLPLPFTPTNISYLIGTLFLPILLIVTGSQPSAIRAFAMILAYLPNKLLERKANFARIIVITVIIVLLIDRANLYDIGFQLSLFSVIAIKIIVTYLKDNTKTVKIFLFMILIPIFMIPLTSLYFKKVYLASMLFSLLLPIFSLLISLLFLTFAIFCVTGSKSLIELLNPLHLQLIETITTVGNTNIIKSMVLDSTKSLTILSFALPLVTLSILEKRKKLRILFLILTFIVTISSIMVKISNKDGYFFFDFGGSTVTLVKEGNKKLLVVGNLKSKKVIPHIKEALLYQDVTKVNEVIDIGKTSKAEVIETLKHEFKAENMLSKREESDNCYFHIGNIEFVCNLANCNGRICQDPWGNLLLNRKFIDLSKTGMMVLEDVR